MAGPAPGGGDGRGAAGAGAPAAPIVGFLQGQGVRVALACSRFNELVTERLLAGARDGLVRHGVDPDDITVAWAPGAFELPLVAQHLAGSGVFDAVICLGAVIRGATGHYDQVANQCAAGIQRAQLSTGVPVIFGVLTTDTIEQALERAGTKAGNKGAEAAAAAIEMADLFRQLAHLRPRPVTVPAAAPGRPPAPDPSQAAPAPVRGGGPDPSRAATSLRGAAPAPAPSRPAG